MKLEFGFMALAALSALHPGIEGQVRIAMALRATKEATWFWHAEMWESCMFVKPDHRSCQLWWKARNTIIARRLSENLFPPPGERD